MNVQAQLRRKHQAPTGASTSHYDFHGLPICVSADDPVVLSDIDRRLFAFRSKRTSESMIRFDFHTRSLMDWVDRPSPAKDARPVYDGSGSQVTYSESQEQLYMEVEDRITASGDCCSGYVRVTCRPRDGQISSRDRWLLSHPILTLPLLELLKRRNLYNVHASCASIEGRAIVLPGSSGSGKSTLAVALALAGFEFQGDDMLFLANTSAGPQVRAFPDEIDISTETAMFFPELAHLAQTPRRAGWPKHGIRAESDLGARVVLEAQPAVVVFPTIAAAKESRLAPIGQSEALLELLPNVLLTDREAALAHVDALNELVERTPCFRLFTGRDWTETSRLLRSTLAG